MSILLERIKALRMDAFRNKVKDKRFAYEFVITEVQTKQGRGEFVDDSLVIDTIKKEISRYTEMNRPVEVEILTELLPKQLTTEKLKELFATYSENEEEKLNPKTFMSKLDSDGHAGCYNKCDVAKIALGKM